MPPSSSSSSSSQPSGVDVPGNINSDKKNFFFSKVRPDQRRLLQLDEEAMYSVPNRSAPSRARTYSMSTLTLTLTLISLYIYIYIFLYL